MDSGDTSLLPPGQTWPGLLSLHWCGRSLSCGSAWVTTCARGPGARCTIHGHAIRCRVFSRSSRLSLTRRRSLPAVTVIRRSRASYGGQERFVVTMLSVNRYIFDPADWRHSRWIVPLGASGHPGSPHFADQGHLWADVATIPQLWDWDDISTAAETRQQLLPGA